MIWAGGDARPTSARAGTPAPRLRSPSHGNFGLPHGSGSPLPSPPVNPVFHRSLAILAVAFAAAVDLRGEDEFELGVRTTPPLSSEDQRAKFKLPPGFEIQLVTREPDINKPMNLAFDATGRLWATTSIEYPFPAPTNRSGRDRVMIFEDFGPDGRARKTTQFADGLNIPIGVYPFRNGDGHWKAIVWSIPNIWLLEDTDGDGKADKKTVLYGPFDHTRDTHGNQSSFRRGFDGWMYATHGFNNDSHVTAPDGSRVDLNSGNTYRIRPDGSRIEQHTHGQVNPFGLAWDARGNLYSSDCHSAPIYQLLDGGWYPSFGKPHDGLGYAPVMLEHAHGSTAIDGAFYYNDDLWPAEYRDTFFIGNVMTSRLNRDKIVFDGSSPRAVEQPDFLTTTDPWFRPVDNTLGPDGALYVADFYNRIIGHYEVPLQHPGRDRERGRIWRVVYKGADGNASLRSPALATDLAGLVGELASPNLTRRLGAMAELEDRFGTEAKPAVRAAFANPSNAFQQAHALWMLERLGELTEADLAKANGSPDALVRVHAQRVQADVLYRATRRLPVTPNLATAARAGALAGLKDADALVRRCAAEALGNAPDSATALRPLLALLDEIPAADTHLRYVVRKSIRDHLAADGTLGKLGDAADFTAGQRTTFTELAIAIPNADGARWLLRELSTLSEKTVPTLDLALGHVARHAPEEDLARLAAFASEKFAARPDSQLVLFKSVDEGLRRRGLALPAPLREWGSRLVTGLLAGGDASAGWYNVPSETSPTANPWDYENRHSTDGVAGQLLSSFPHGEGLTGTLRSPAFDAPAELSFWLCGHDGPPDKPVLNRNVVRLRSVATGAVLFEARPPRDDTAHRVVWKAGGKNAGQKVRLEVTDGDTGSAYAWLAFGRIEPAVVSLPKSGLRTAVDQFVTAADLATRLGLSGNAGTFLAKARETDGDTDVRVAAARAALSLDAPDAASAMGAQLSEPANPAAFVERLGEVLAQDSHPASRAAVAGALKTAPRRLESRWATALTASRDGAEALLAALENGSGSPRVLQSAGAKNRLQAAAPRDWEARLARLTKDLPSADDSRDKLVSARRNAFVASTDSRVADGERVFVQNCAVCHQIDGKGGLVGPQLVGIGNRGVERLCEDILDPNRNVDRAFRQTILTLKSGDSVNGLFRREEGATLVLANALGAEVSVAKADVAGRQESELSLMPDNFADAIPGPEFNHLLAYLLAHRGK